MKKVTFTGRSEKEAKMNMLLQTKGKVAYYLDDKVTVRRTGLFGLFGEKEYEISALLYDRYEAESIRTGSIRPMITKQKQAAAQLLTEDKQKNMHTLQEVPHSPVLPIQSSSPTLVPAQELLSVKSSLVHTSSQKQTVRQHGGSINPEVYALEAEVADRFKRFQKLQQATVQHDRQMNTVVSEEGLPAHDRSGAMVNRRASQEDSIHGTNENNYIINELKQLRSDFQKLFTAQHEEKNSNQDNKAETTHTADMQETADTANLTELLNHLKRNHVDADIIAMVKEVCTTELIPWELKDRAIIKKKIFEKIKRLVKVSGPIKVPDEKKRIVFVIGPPGMGKTTTLGKIAAEYHLKKNHALRFISIDNYRLAAPQQLQAFASILKVPCDIVTGPDDFKKTVSAAKENLILVDTTGRAHTNKKMLEELQQFLLAVQDNESEVHLVVGANVKEEDLYETIDEYSFLKFDRIIFTKLDMTKSFGGIINAVGKKKIPVSYMCYGQEVPQDITLATTDRLANMVLEEQDYGRSS